MALTEWGPRHLSMPVASPLSDHITLPRELLPDNGTKDCSLQMPTDCMWPLLWKGVRATENGQARGPLSPQRYDIPLDGLKELGNPKIVGWT